MSELAGLILAEAKAGGVWTGSVADVLDCGGGAFEGSGSRLRHVVGE